MLDQIRQQLLEMVTQGHKPAAIIMTPVEMKRFEREVRDSSPFTYSGRSPAGWKFQDVPIYRSYEISGPCVVTEDVLGMLQRAGRVRSSGSLQQSFGSADAIPTQPMLDPILF